MAIDIQTVCFSSAISAVLGIILTCFFRGSYHHFRVIRPLVTVLDRIARGGRLTIVYSHTPVTGFMKVNGSSRIDYPFLEREKQVTTFLRRYLYWIHTPHTLFGG